MPATRSAVESNVDIVPSHSHRSLRAMHRPRELGPSVLAHHWRGLRRMAVSADQCQITPLRFIRHEASAWSELNFGDAMPRLQIPYYPTKWRIWPFPSNPIPIPVPLRIGEPCALPATFIRRMLSVGASTDTRMGVQRSMAEGEDKESFWAPLKSASSGDACPRCTYRVGGAPRDRHLGIGTLCQLALREKNCRSCMAKSLWHGYLIRWTSEFSRSSFFGGLSKPIVI